MVRFSVGVPPLVTTFTTSPKLTVAVTVSPAFKVLFCAPVEPVSATAVTVGCEAIVTATSVSTISCAALFSAL